MLEQLYQELGQDNLDAIVSICQIVDKDNLQPWDLRNINLAKEMLLQGKSREEIESSLSFFVEKAEVCQELEWGVIEATLSGCSLETKNSYSLVEAFRFAKARQLITQGLSYELLPLALEGEQFKEVLSLVSLAEKPSYSTKETKTILSAYKLKLQGASDADICREFSPKEAKKTGKSRKKEVKPAEDIELASLPNVLSEKLSRELDLDATVRLLQSANVQIKTSYLQVEIERIVEAINNVSTDSNIAQNKISALLDSAKKQPGLEKFVDLMGREVGNDLGRQFTEAVLNNLSSAMTDNPVIEQINRELEQLLEGKSALPNGSEYLISTTILNSDNLLPPSKG